MPSPPLGGGGGGAGAGGGGAGGASTTGSTQPCGAWPEAAAAAPAAAIEVPHSAAAEATPLNALSAADTLLVPLQCEFFALEGLSQLLQTVEQVQQRFNPDLGIVGIALTMFDRRNRMTDQVADDVRECLGKLVFEAVIPRNVRLSEAPSHGRCVMDYAPRSRVARAYIELCMEVQGRE